MSSSPYARDVQHILAALQTPGDAQEQPLPEEEPVNTIYVYPTDQGGLLFSPTRIEGDEEDDTPPAPIVESEPPAPAPRKAPPHFLYFVLVLLLFLLLDSASTALTNLMTPTATITIVPRVQTITLRSTAQLGKILAPITVSESLTVPTTGHGHQDAKAATGILTFYNGLSTAQTIAAGTVLTGRDGIQVVTNTTVTIPPVNPPSLGEAQEVAYALQPDINGNISAEDINISLATGLYVKNLTPFTGGQDARDFQVVTQADITTAAATLKTKVSNSMTAALQGQLLPGQELTLTPCPPHVTTDHAVGDEAATVQVTVSESCTAIAYDAMALQTKAMQLLTAQVAKTLDTGYRHYGTITVMVTKASTQQHSVLLSFTCQGTWVYQINEAQIQALVSGKPRLDALQLLAHLPGIQHVSISGIADNQPIPDDVTHIHLLIIVAAF